MLIDGQSLFKPKKTFTKTEPPGIVLEKPDDEDLYSEFTLLVNNEPVDKYSVVNDEAGPVNNIINPDSSKNVLEIADPNQNNYSFSKTNEPAFVKIKSTESFVKNKKKVSI